MLLNCVGLALAKNGSFAKLGFCVGLCGFANVLTVHGLLLLSLSFSFLLLLLSFRVCAKGWAHCSAADVGSKSCEYTTKSIRGLMLYYPLHPAINLKHVIGRFYSYRKWLHIICFRKFLYAISKLATAFLSTFELSAPNQFSRSTIATVICLPLPNLLGRLMLGKPNSFAFEIIK